VRAVYSRTFPGYLSYCIIVNQRAEADSDLVCQPGARWMDINDELALKGKDLYSYRGCSKPCHNRLRYTIVFPRKFVHCLLLDVDRDHVRGTA
jgi:hypothetical protein